MKRVARVLGVLGGVAALIWAMRDRLVSIAAPREPEPPRFRVVPPAPADEPDVSEDDLTTVNGIGPVFAARLKAAGISNVADLASADQERVAEAAGVPLSRVGDWIEQASARIG